MSTAMSKNANTALIFKECGDPKKLTLAQQTSERNDSFALRTQHLPDLGESLELGDDQAAK